MINAILRRLVTFSRRDGVPAGFANALIYNAKHASTLVLSDEHYVQCYARLRLGKWSNLQRPRTFNEKIQWLKLNYRRPEFVNIVDKYAVRDFVASRVGPEVLIPIYAIYNDVDEIRLDDLPSSFVLKPTHGSGWVIVCRDKEKFDWTSAQRLLRRWLRQNYYYHAREWVYKHVPPRITCEQLLLGDDGQPPSDYKLFCFGGEPRYVQIDFDRFGKQSRDFYDTDWRRIDLRLRYPSSSRNSARPPQLDDMLRLARVLAQGIPFARVDLYLAQSKIFFGELTLYPGNGVVRFEPAYFDREFGEAISLPEPFEAGGLTYYSGSPAIERRHELHRQ